MKIPFPPPIKREEEQEHSFRDFDKFSDEEEDTEVNNLPSLLDDVEEMPETERE